MMRWCLSSCLLIAAVILLRQINGSWVSARVRYTVWLVVLAGLLIPFRTVVYYNSIFDTRIIAAWLAQWDELMTEKQALLHLLTVMYLLGVVVTGGGLLLGNLRFGNRLRRCGKPASVVGTAVPVYVAEGLESPCLFGGLRPRIYLTPQVYEDEALLRYALLHESSHFRRKDHIWSLLRCVCLCLHWYNPFVWLAAYLSKIDGELACDEAVVHAIGYENRFDYGRALIAVTCGASASLPVAAVTLIGSECMVKRRVLRIAAEPYTPISEVIWTGWMLCLIVLHTCL